MEAAQLDPVEILARDFAVRAQTREIRQSRDPDDINAGPEGRMSCCPTCGQAVPPSRLLVSLDTHRVARNGVVVQLTPQEVVVSFLLDAKAPAIASKSYLLNGIYGARGGPEDENNLLRVVIHNLRPKLAELGVEIEAIRSKGYRLNVSEHCNA